MLNLNNSEIDKNGEYQTKLPLYFEAGHTYVNKTGEELCGDNVESVVKNGYLTLVLADGMGSGVKANILAILTSKILSTMVSENIPIYDCLETILQSLPVCKVRKVAYSTFSVIHINREGKGHMFEFDNPQAILLKDGKCISQQREELHVLGKKIYKTELFLEPGDLIITMSDGAVNAGIGKVLNFGWQREHIVKYLEEKITPQMSAKSVACLLVAACNELYLSMPGDDTTVAAVKIRERVTVDIMVGPPVDKEMDNFYVAEFLKRSAKKIVCGGTSSQIVSKYLGKQLETTFDFPDKDIPPIAKIDGIDLTTEGVITLRRVLELSEKYLSNTDLTPKHHTQKDGASLLANMLFEEATDINFFVGQSVNVAHQGLPIDTTMKIKLIETLSANLKKMDKNVTVTYD